ncbi:MAG TPA: transposase [Gemmata sp.]|nr:transposase [Gemmata sp.]
MRRLRRIEPDAGILFEDETTLRWFPPLRGMWARRGEQAKVRITGQNAKRILFGTINPRTGHRIVLRRAQARQADFQAFLRLLRQRYGGRPLYLLLDKAPCHDTPGSRALAVRLSIELVWLPKQCSELNAMDHLWRHVKGEVSANWQWTTVDEHADRAEEWVLDLSDREALRKAGILSEDFWLRHL